MATLKEFVVADNSRGLFPLASTSILIETGEADIRRLVETEILKDPGSEAFVPCPIAYALKDPRHLRRCLVLDPIASFFLYAFVHRNARSFQKPAPSNRRSYGYAFINKQPIGSFSEYHEFRKTKYQLKSNYKYFAHVDIANCFNSFYHHDVVSMLSDEISQPESAKAGKFLREINSGRSINCFPQGIYPAKVIGNFYLQFIERSRELQSERIIRFIDDILFFADDRRTIEQDVIILQQLIGERSLALNAAKTLVGDSSLDFDERKLDDLKRSLLRKREKSANYDQEEDEEEDEQEAVELTDTEASYLRNLIRQSHVEEEDVELAISLLSKDPSQVERLTSLVVNRYPNLLRSLHRLTSDIDDNGVIWNTLNARLTQTQLTEFELFWIARILIDHYQFNSEAADVLIRIFHHPSATVLVKAAILEVQHNKFGMLELKVQQLRQASSSLMALASAVGLRDSEKAKRNQLYKYAAKASSTMKVVCGICSRL